MPRKGVSAVADFGDQIVEDKLKKDDEDFQSEVNFYNSNIHSDQVAKADFDAEKALEKRLVTFL